MPAGFLAGDATIAVVIETRECTVTGDATSSRGLKPVSAAPARRRHKLPSPHSPQREPVGQRERCLEQRERCHDGIPNGPLPGTERPCAKDAIGGAFEAVMSDRTDGALTFQTE